jgi:plasmid stabilization system protein ParE
MTSAVLSRAADNDLEQVARWIAKEDFQAAKNFRQSVAEAGRRLSDHKNLGVERPDLTAREPAFSF